MDIGVPYRGLGKVDITELQQVLESQPDSLWEEDRALKMELSPRRDTDSIYLIYTTGWPEFTTNRYAGWNPLSETCVPIIRSLLKEYPPGWLANAMFARIPPGGKIPVHFDKSKILQEVHRCHIPIRTNESVRFLVEGKPIPVHEGEAFELNNTLYHGVFNDSDVPRTHLVFDYLPASSGARPLRQKAPKKKKSTFF